ncbi:MAG: hypothetical protein J4G14_14870, partial [Dehalococcoidia bacterium]|nr:hypothetical protein [Dehalococcoidia bacterium]
MVTPHVEDKQQAAAQRLVSTRQTVNRRNVEVFRMTVHLNREIKAYCPDFVPVRQLLKDDGATFIETKEQVDYYYHLPELGNDEGTRRLNLRIEGKKKELIYYEDYQETDTRVSQFQLWQMPGHELLEVLDAALG